MAGLADKNVEHLGLLPIPRHAAEMAGPQHDRGHRAGRADQVAVLLVPIAFVSDHIETLVELDIENRELAAHHNVPGYFRAAVPNADPAFIARFGRADAARFGAWRWPLRHNNGRALR